MFFVKQPLKHVFGLSFSTGIVPEQFKMAKVVPIFKSGDPRSGDNNRPISLLNNFSKIIEKIMCLRLTAFLESNSLISRFQFGFRKSHSTLHPHIFKTLLHKLLTTRNTPLPFSVTCTKLLTLSLIIFF